MANQESIIKVETKKILKKLKLMIDAINSQHELARIAIANTDKSVAISVLESDAAIDSRYDEIESDLAFLISMRPLAKELRRTLAYLFIVSELERIGDYSKHIAKFIIKEKVQIAASSKARIRSIHKPLREMLTMLYDVIKSEDPEKARNLAKLDHNINSKTNVARKAIIVSLAQKSDEKEVGQRVFVLNVINALERAADHIVNICEMVTYIYSGKHSSLDD